MNTKARHDALRAAAHAALIDYGYARYERLEGEARRIALKTMAQMVISLTNCTPESARRHVAAAIRRERGQEVSQTWGGYRPGAGRPPETKE